MGNSQNCTRRRMLLVLTLGQTTYDTVSVSKLRSLCEGPISLAESTAGH
jgi:hypothetical protein